MISLPSVVYRFWIPPVTQVIVAPQSGHVANPCKDVSISINIVKCYIGVQQQALVILPSNVIFKRNAVIFFYLHSHLEHQWHLVFAKIMIVLRLYIESICSYKLVWSSSEPPQPLLTKF